MDVNAHVENDRQQLGDSLNLAVHAAETVMVNTLRRRMKEGGDRAALVQKAAEEVILGANCSESQLAGAVEGVVCGAIRTSEEFEMEKDKAAEAAALGAWEAASESCGKAATEHLKKVLTREILGVQPLNAAVLDQHGRRTP